MYVRVCHLENAEKVDFTYYNITARTVTNDIVIGILKLLS